MRLTYQAFDRAGQAVAATIEASSAAEATENLRRQGLFVTAMASAGGDPAAAPHASPRRPFGLRPFRGRLKNLAMFWRQLYVLTSTGTPLVPALSALERQSKEPEWRAMLATLRQRVEEGEPLSVAMQQYPDVFHAVHRSLVAAGESSGDFGKMLDRLAALTRRQMQVRGAVIGASVYPALLVGVALAVLLLLLMFVLPRFAGLFDTLGAPLPPTTAALLVVGESLRAYWWLLALLIAGGVIGLKTWLPTPEGRRTVNTLVLRVPVLGQSVRSFATARIARVLGVLIEGHVPLLEALGLTREVAGNQHFAALVARAEAAVSRGEPMSAAFADTDLISPSVYEALRSGEQTGQLGPLLLNLSDFLDEENEVVVKSLTSILEPVILIALGLMVGFIALSMFMPLFDLTSMTGPGGAG